MPATIYIYLPDEAVDTWRPVEAEQIGDNLFRILNSVPQDEVWQFQPGDVVRCDEKTLVDGIQKVTQLVAVELSAP